MLSDNRDCINGKFFIQSGEPRHCDRDGLSSGCKTTTVCGTVTVPSDHLQVIYEPTYILDNYEYNDNGNMLQYTANIG